MRARIVVLAALLTLSACEINFTTEPVLICVVDGDTLGVSGDSSGIRCAPIDDVPPDSVAP